MGKIIHVIEDDSDIRFIIEYVLLEADYEVITSATGKEFYEKIGIQHPELTLLDVMFPNGNGIDTCRALKKDQKTSHIPIVIMSAHTTE
ncbi:response regulator [Pedobacter sp. B4-66]|uniref:response regulator n=1 Tax=Pedobacter sp. B4-66 TaxID=2817280 RepID=UPI001BD9DA5C|nr:response regulator [Pedobacter sp. B4-66]